MAPSLTIINGAIAGRADTDLDGDVGIVDLLELLANWTP